MPPKCYKLKKKNARFGKSGRVARKTLFNIPRAAFLNSLSGNPPPNANAPLLPGQKTGGRGWFGRPQAPAARHARFPEICAGPSGCFYARGSSSFSKHLGNDKDYHCPTQASPEQQVDD